MRFLNPIDPYVATPFFIFLDSKDVHCTIHIKINQKTIMFLFLLAILALFLRDDLSFSESFSTVMLHIFNFFGQFTPIFGAILADSYIGNVQTISYFCVIYAVGWYGLFLTSFPSNQLPLLFMVSLSLLLISIGNGSIRACITSLGAKQFEVPDQNKLLSDYFSHYYFVYYMGIFMSKIIPPMIRAETSCFGKDGCYPAVFGALGSVFMMSWSKFLTYFQV